MVAFRVAGRVDPLLEVQLNKGENIFAESGSMVSMDTTLELSGEATGGVMQALQRKVLQGESFFLQSITATGGDGQVILAPNLPGDIRVLEVGASQYRLADGAFLARTSGVELKSKMQGVGQGFFGGTGGFVIVEASGSGILALSGPGYIHSIEVKRGHDVIVDNGHALAWDTSLSYELSMTTNKSKSVFKKLLNSQTSGEGLVLRFSGEGKIFICSRNQSIANLNTASN